MCLPVVSYILTIVTITFCDEGRLFVFISYSSVLHQYHINPVYSRGSSTGNALELKMLICYCVA